MAESRPETRGTQVKPGETGPPGSTIRFRDCAFENANTGIRIERDNVHLDMKNVRFKNVRTPIDARRGGRA